MSAAVDAPIDRPRLARLGSAALRREPLLLALALALPWLLHLLTFVAGEPFFNNDETRHFMTGVFVRDFLLQGAWSEPMAYAERYFVQYPALSLLTWPPFYYGFEGVFFTVAGFSLTSAKLLIGLHATLAGVYLYLLARHTHGVRVALLALVFWSLAPLIFEFSRHVMLEMPTLAYSIAALFHFVRHLDTSSRRHLLASAAFTSFAVLTRFDGFFVLLAFGLILVARREWSRVLSVDAGLFVAVLGVATVPYYAFMISEIGWFHWYAITTGTTEQSTSFFAPGNFLYYLTELPTQLGWPTLIVALAGLLHATLTRSLSPLLPWLATFVASLAMASSAAEVESRHSIYGLASLCVLAACGVTAVGRRASDSRRAAASVGLAVAMIAGAAYANLARPALYVRGYAAAADYVIAQSVDERFCLFDGVLDANFTYHIRRNDAARQLHVLRGDKLVYTVLSDTRGGYREFAQSQDEVLAVLERYDPRMIVIEDSAAARALPAARLLRETLAAHPAQFRLEARFPVDSNRARIEGTTLQVYRKVQRNPQAERELAIPASGLRRMIGPAAGEPATRASP